MTPEEAVSFFYLVLKHSELSPDWWAIGAEYSNVAKATKSQKDKV